MGRTHVPRQCSATAARYTACSRSKRDTCICQKVRHFGAKMAKMAKMAKTAARYTACSRSKRDTCTCQNVRHLGAKIQQKSAFAEAFCPFLLERAPAMANLNLTCWPAQAEVQETPHLIMSTGACTQEHMHTRASMARDEWTPLRSSLTGHAPPRQTASEAHSLCCSPWQVQPR